MAEKKMLAPDICVRIVAESGIALTSPVRPTAAELNLGTDITCAIEESSYNFNPTDSEKNGSKSLCDIGTVVNFTSGNYEGGFNLFMSDLVNVTALYNTANALFETPGFRFWLCERVGYGQALTAAVGQEWRCGLFENDLIREERSDEDDYQTVVTLIPQGDYNRFTLTA